MRPICIVFIFGDKKFDAVWRIYASANQAIIGSGNGLSPVQRQAII